MQSDRRIASMNNNVQNSLIFSNVCKTAYWEIHLLTMINIKNNTDYIKKNCRFTGLGEF
jgi:hypothetical protein